MQATARLQSQIQVLWCHLVVQKVKEAAVRQWTIDLEVGGRAQRGHAVEQAVRLMDVCCIFPCISGHLPDIYATCT